MTRSELRVFLGEHFCGCGSPGSAAGALLRLLRLHPLYEDPGGLDGLLPDVGFRFLLLYWLDRLELAEHGGSVEGAWLTEKGAAVMGALAAEESDDFAALFADHCACGFDVDDESHDCFA